MVYKKKLTVLSGIVAALAVAYILTFIFDPDRMGSRADAYSWLDPAMKDRIDGITITGGSETVALARRGGEWFVSRGGKDYPARSMRVDDLIGALTRRAPYSVSSSSASSHARLSLTEGSAARIRVTGGAGLPLLSLLVGQGDVTGQNVYLRKEGQNEVRSGEDIFSAYAQSTLASWYNLRLFPESERGKLDVTKVQRLTVYPSSQEGEETEPYIFTRRGREWAFSGMEIENPNMGSIDNYVSDIINTAGDDFDDTVTASDPMFNDSRIVLELGDGSIRTIRLGPPEEDGRRLALVSGSDFVYSLPAWASSRLFAEPYSFENN
ncbi:MAG: DUF4340 domain-containing protein [Treponema sp.]|jgi:hypothetical protein|nr:DUF4340 domain-containing protein [Treponema sp.]